MRQHHFCVQIPIYRTAFVVVANKLDKLKKSEIEPNLKSIREDLELPEDCILLPFSAEKGTGKDELVKLILACVEV